MKPEFQQGHDALLEGLDRDTNPYPENSDLGEAWDEGYTSAVADCESEDERNEPDGEE